MHRIIFKDYFQLSQYAANEMAMLLKEKPNAVICLASGNSPKLACELFAKKIIQEKIYASKFFLIGLDEWVGLSPNTFGSCFYDFKTRIIEPLGLLSNQFHFFDALANDLQNECATMDKIIKEKGGIDLMIVGIGMNGHIGFNEPGVGFNLLSHVIELDETTKIVGQKYFKEKVILQKGITLGLANLMNAKKVLLLANGIEKAGVIKKAAEEKITCHLPASIMQQHSNGFILVDEAAASLLNNKKE